MVLRKKDSKMHVQRSTVARCRGFCWVVHAENRLFDNHKQDTFLILLKLSFFYHRLMSKRGLMQPELIINSFFDTSHCFPSICTVLWRLNSHAKGCGAIFCFPRAGFLGMVDCPCLEGSILQASLLEMCRAWPRAADALIGVDLFLDCLLFGSQLPQLRISTNCWGAVLLFQKISASLLPCTSIQQSAS